MNLPSSQDLAHKAAVEGIVLLKNDGILPLKGSVKNVALIGPWANATTPMQGNYEGIAPFLISPVSGAQAAGYSVTYSAGTSMNSNDTSGFAAALATAKSADVIVFAGGIDETIERESLDRVQIGWPGNQPDLISQLEQLNKPLVIVQFGGGQVDDSALKASKSVSNTNQVSSWPSYQRPTGQCHRLGRISWPKRRPGPVRHHLRQGRTSSSPPNHSIPCRLRQSSPNDRHDSPTQFDQPRKDIQMVHWYPHLRIWVRPTLYYFLLRVEQQTPNTYQYPVISQESQIISGTNRSRHVRDIWRSNQEHRKGNIRLCLSPLRQWGVRSNTQTQQGT